MSPSNDPGRPYVTVTADTHAGASIEMYREFLDPGHREDFDAWRSGYRNPSKKHIGGKKTKNWDSPNRPLGPRRTAPSARPVWSAAETSGRKRRDRRLHTP